MNRERLLRDIRDRDAQTELAVAARTPLGRRGTAYDHARQQHSDYHLDTDTLAMGDRHMLLVWLREVPRHILDGILAGPMDPADWPTGVADWTTAPALTASEPGLDAALALARLERFIDFVHGTPMYVTANGIRQEMPRRFHDDALALRGQLAARLSPDTRQEARCVVCGLPDRGHADDHGFSPDTPQEDGT